jgi:hypothetical protein
MVNNKGAETMSREQYWIGHESCKIMLNQGGFAEMLAKAYYKADNSNADKLFHAFPELFKQSLEAK